jgi:four helix bundle protein
MDNLVPEKVFDIKFRTLKFSVLIIKLSLLLPRNAAGFAIASQIVRSGTSIGANIHEAQDSSSKKEFIHSMTISLKEARETEY